MNFNAPLDENCVNTNSIEWFKHSESIFVCAFPLKTVNEHFDKGQYFSTM